MRTIAALCARYANGPVKFGYTVEKWYILLVVLRGDARSRANETRGFSGEGGPLGGARTREPEAPWMQSWARAKRGDFQLFQCIQVNLNPPYCTVVS